MTRLLAPGMPMPKVYDGEKWVEIGPTEALVAETAELRRRIDDLLVSNNEYLERWRVAMRERDAMLKALLSAADLGGALAKEVRRYISDPILEEQKEAPTE